MDSEPITNDASTDPALALLERTALDVTRILQIFYLDIEGQISRADLKAQITLSTSAVLAAVMTNLGLGVKSWNFEQGGGVIELAAMISYIFSAMCLCFAIGHALAAAYPRAIGKNRTPLDDLNLFFSAHIIQIPAAEYSQRFCDLTNLDVKHRILQQVHAKSRVLEAKLHYIRRGLATLVGAMAFWALARLLLLFVSGGLEVPAQILPK